MSLLDVFTGDSAKKAAADNAALYQNYGTQATGAINSALPQSTGALNSAVGAYTPLSDLGTSLGKGTSAYMDALGLNGAEGTARSTAAYQGSPGYHFQVDAATDAAARNGAKLGLAGSGNTLQAISDRAQGIANTDYNQNYLQPLSGFINPQISATGAAASGVAQGDTNLSNLYQTNASNLANIYGNVAGGNAASNTAAANAQTNASSSFWNALLGAAGAAAKGGSGGGGFTFGGLPGGSPTA